MAFTKIVDVDKVTNAKAKVHRVGIELEGGWLTYPKTLPPRDTPGGIIRDGSLDPFQRRRPDLFMGELPSPPLAMDEWEKWLRLYWPTEVSPECGLHVHMSFRSAFQYVQLMKEEYPGTIVAQTRKWAERNKLAKDHCLWERLDGKSVYCQHVYNADDQVLNTRKDHDKTRRGHRYTVANYCWGRIPTVEIRLLPMMPTVDLGVSAVADIIETTNKFLAAQGARKRTTRVAPYIIDASSHVEDVVVRV